MRRAFLALLIALSFATVAAGVRFYPAQPDGGADRVPTPARAGLAPTPDLGRPVADEAPAGVTHVAAKLSPVSEDKALPVPASLATPTAPGSFPAGAPPAPTFAPQGPTADGPGGKVGSGGSGVGKAVAGRGLSGPVALPGGGGNPLRTAAPATPDAGGPAVGGVPGSTAHGKVEATPEPGGLVLAALGTAAVAAWQLRQSRRRLAGSDSDA